MLFKNIKVGYYLHAYIRNKSMIFGTLTSVRGIVVFVFIKKKCMTKYQKQIYINVIFKNNKKKVNNEEVLGNVFRQSEKNYIIDKRFFLFFNHSLWINKGIIDFLDVSLRFPELKKVVYGIGRAVNRGLAVDFNFLVFFGVVIHACLK